MIYHYCNLIFTQGITTFSTIMGLYAMSRKVKLPRRAALATNLLALGIVAQVSLPICK